MLYKNHQIIVESMLIYCIYIYLFFIYKKIKSTTTIQQFGASNIYFFVYLFIFILYFYSAWIQIDQKWR